jgi:NAD(P)H-hydrate epimerase
MACVKENYALSATSIPEAILLPCDSSDGRFSSREVSRIKEQMKSADAILIGCGLGVSFDTAELVKELIKTAEIPIILDADGINNITDSIDFIKQAKAPVILTPHPGEMARLCKKSVKEIESERLKIASEFSKENNVYLVLKGANTVISSPAGDLFVNICGNPGMAKGGSGDMLSGMILSFLAQKYDILCAVKTAVWLHSTAGDMAAQDYSQNSMLPSDMINELPRLFSSL